MASISSLPDEILLGITTWLEYDRRALCNLALVCHRFRRVAQEIIFRNAVRFISSDNSPALLSQFGELELLARSFRENPKLKNFVWSYGPINHFHIDDETGELMFRILIPDACPEPVSSFPNIKHLRLFLNCRETSCEIGALRPLYHPQYMHLITSITLLGTPCRNIVLQCLILPKLKTMRIDKVQSPFPSVTHPDTMIRSGLQHLIVFDSNIPVAIEEPMSDHVLGQLLISCPDLVELRWCPKITHVYTSKPTGSFFWKCSRDTVVALAPVARTLKVLELVDRGVTTFASMTTSRSFPLDLRGLVGLRSLKISSFFLVPVEDSSAREVYKRRKDRMCHDLPSGLENLHITFPANMRIFNDSRRGRDDQRTNSNEQHEWMLQFTTAKRENLPYLTQVVLEDVRDSQLFYTSSFRSVIWEQPESLKTTFREASVDLHVRIEAGTGTTAQVYTSLP